jgi:hypothetical protein
MKYISMLIVGAVLVLGQHSTKSAGRVPPSSSSGPGVLVDFAGTASIVTAKKLTLTPEDSKRGEDANTMDFEITRKTVVTAGDRKLKITDLKPGDEIIVESKRLLDGTLEAVTVRKTGS